MQVHGCFSGKSVDLPTPVELSATRQVDGIGGPDRYLARNFIRLADKIEHLRNKMRANLDQDIAWIAEHPCVERPMQQLRERAA